LGKKNLDLSFGGGKRKPRHGGTQVLRGENKGARTATIEKENKGALNSGIKKEKKGKPNGRQLKYMRRRKSYF